MQGSTVGRLNCREAQLSGGSTVGGSTVGSSTVASSAVGSTSLIVYKHSTDTRGMRRHVFSCPKTASINALNEKKTYFIL